MPEPTARNIAFTALIIATVAAVLAAVFLFARQNDNAPIRIIAPNAISDAEQVLAEVRVYVSGAVTSPGVYTLNSEARITDAIAVAGDVTADGVLDGLNLALRVTDEAEYYVPKLDEIPPTGARGPASGTGPAGQSGDLANLNLASEGDLINLNQASVEMLDTLPGIGPVLAQAIVDYRENVRPFQSIAKIQEVPKIGPGTFQDIRDLVTVSGVR